MKVLRLHDSQYSGGDSINGWGKTSGAISPKAIETIIDPQNQNSKTEITSIPSPFARLDLFKQAFQYVVNSKQLDGNNIYYKLVSDCLDQ